MPISYSTESSFNFHPGYIPGQYYNFTPFLGTLGSNNPTVQPLMMLYGLMPIFEDIQIDRLVVNVTTANTNAILKIGIYDIYNGRPNKLIMPDVNIDCSTTAIKEIIIPSLQLKKNNYALAYASNTNIGLNGSTNVSGGLNFWGMSSSSVNFSTASSTYYHSGFTFGSFPEIAPVSNLLIASWVPLLRFRVKP
ncbi:hypothetical protein [Halotia branconii]|uniref:Uncharacterized protein n=1 Tax=Halotia branconii CENA392 TaxID=1539056 RepID=A0AAJ6P9S0_9CYAN|nr:hypothetical protein [Halotia branconii]WGV25977.1 hypothetical protein QI031_00175 [Halotia branconii CENA392]